MVQIKGVNLLLVACVVLLSAGCSQVARVFLDLPPGEGPSGPSPEVTRSYFDSIASRLATDRVPMRRADTLPIERIFDPDSALALLPKAEEGWIDWKQAIQDTVIILSKPGGELEAPPNFGFDFIWPGADALFDTSFPHSAHVAWLDCQSCHPTIFPNRGERTSMAEIGSGETCGACHGKVAFPTTQCGRCHTNMGMPVDQPEPLSGTVLVAKSGEDEEGVEVSPRPYPVAEFPHWIHRIRYRCASCHPSPFALEAGGTGITMDQVQAGEACGICHNGEEAFSAAQCSRCHESPSGGASRVP